MHITELNTLSAEQAQSELFKCCGSTRWAKTLAEERPFSDLNTLLLRSDAVWAACGEADGLEAFTHHPKIGDLKSLEKKFSTTKEWAGGEQGGINHADASILRDLAAGNSAYEQKFGFIFIVCATGKSATEMLDLLNARLGNDPAAELKIAMIEQNKITRLRLEKLIA